MSESTEIEASSLERHLQQEVDILRIQRDAAYTKIVQLEGQCVRLAQSGKAQELDQLYSMLGAEDQIGAAKKIAELVGCQISRTALTDAQMRRLYENSTDTENERLGFASFARLMRRAEAVHQITAAPSATD